MSASPSRDPAPGCQDPDGCATWSWRVQQYLETNRLMAERLFRAFIQAPSHPMLASNQVARTVASFGLSWKAFAERCCAGLLLEWWDTRGSRAAVPSWLPSLSIQTISVGSGKRPRPKGVPEWEAITEYGRQPRRYRLAIRCVLPAEDVLLYVRAAYDDAPTDPALPWPMEILRVVQPVSEQWEPPDRLRLRCRCGL